MIGAFNSVYASLKSLLSADFWSTVFAPVALFAAIHAAIASRFGVDFGLSKSLGDTVTPTHGIVLVVALVLAGYVLQSFLPLLRGLLDGSLLPGRLHDELRRRRKPAADAARAAIAQAMANVTAFTDERRDAKHPASALQQACIAAQSLPGAPDHPSVDAASRAVAALTAALDAATLPSRADLGHAKSALTAALAANNPGLATGPHAANSLKLAGVLERYNAVLADAANQAVYEYQVLLARLRVPAALATPGATLLGDARYVVERYASDVYSVNFDYLWPRLILVLRADPALAPSLAAVDAAQARVGFAQLALLLTCSVPAVWLPVAIIGGRQGWLILVLGGATPLALRLFYRMAVESQLALGDVVRSTIDRHRLLVLGMLRLPLPTSRRTERDLWTNIRRAEEGDRTVTLTYAAPAAGAP